MFGKRAKEYCATRFFGLMRLYHHMEYSGRKITSSVGNVKVRGEKSWKGGSTMAKGLSEHV
jgi:hypothetical protein